MVHTVSPVFSVRVQLMAATKILAVKVGASTDQACLPCQPACFVLCWLLALLLKWIICDLKCFGQTTFLRYLWIEEVICEKGAETELQ
jgi:hypothetical protein